MKNWFNLSDDEMLDLEIETHDFVGKYLEENIINLHNPNFYDEMVAATASEMYDWCLCASGLDVNSNLEDDSFFEGFQKQIRIYVGSFYEMMGLKRRSYKNPRPQHYLTYN